MKDNPIDLLPKNEWDALIISILKPMYSLCSKDMLVSPEDLQQEAWIGLLRAAERYDPGKAKFTTFAYSYIRGHVMRYVAKRTINKPNQIDLDEFDTDDQSYIDDSSEKHDTMYTIFSKVSNEKYFDLLVEHFIYDKSFRKIAKERGVSHETIATRVNKLLDLLEIRLNPKNA